jgi:hypothetical protein
MREFITMTIALAANALLSTAVLAQALLPTPMFEGNVTTPAKDGTRQSAHVSIQVWVIHGEENVTQEIPIQGFYIAHLISGQISVTSDGRTVGRLPSNLACRSSCVAMAP